MRELKFVSGESATASSTLFFKTTNMISTIGWQSLAERRAIARLTRMYFRIMFTVGSVH